MNALEGKTIRDKRNINIVCNPRNTTVESIMSAANRQVNTIFSNFHSPVINRNPVVHSLGKSQHYTSPLCVRHTHALLPDSQPVYPRDLVLEAAIDLAVLVTSSFASQGRESGKLTCAVQGGVNAVGYVTWRVCMARRVHLEQSEWLVGTPRTVRA